MPSTVVVFRVMLDVPASPDPWPSSGWSLTPVRGFGRVTKPSATLPQHRRSRLHGCDDGQIHSQRRWRAPQGL